MSRGREDNRLALLQYILTCKEQVRTSAYKGATGSRSQSICELTVPTPPMMWMKEVPLPLGSPYEVPVYQKSNTVKRRKNGLWGGHRKCPY